MSFAFSARARDHAIVVALKAGLSGKAAEWVGYVAGWETCFASMTASAREIGRSQRSGFRYQAAAIEAGLIRSQPGDRLNPPKNASIPYMLKVHGYAIRKAIGDLGDTCRDIGRNAWESVQRRKGAAAARKAEQKRQAEKARRAEHEAWKARHPEYAEPPARPVGDLLGQVVGAAAMPQRPAPRRWTAEEIEREESRRVAEAEALGESIPWANTGPPNEPPE